MQAIDWLARHSLYEPDKIALVEVATGRRFTYQGFNEQANCVANFLESLGVKPGDRVAILAPNCAEVLFILFGATKLGAISVPLNFRLAAPELLPIIHDAQPAVLICSEELWPTVESLRPKLQIARYVKLNGQPPPRDVAFAPEMVQQPSHRDKDIPVDMDGPQMLLYTSGTTGKPKGVILSHRMSLWNSVNFALRDLMPTDVVLVHTPMFYTGGLNVYTLPILFLGGTAVLMRAWNADEALQIIERERITVFFAVPTQFLMMADSSYFERVDLSSLRWVISGGAPCPIPLIEQLVKRGLIFKQGFGLTEVGPNCFCLEARDALRKAGSIGFPNFAVRARIVDDDGHDVGPDEVGELILSSPAMCNGYWNNAEATKAAIRQGWFYTGDLAKRDAEGYYYIVDRKKDMYISGGENVYPTEVEQVLVEHPKVAEVAVVGVPHPKWGEVGCAAVVLCAGVQGTEEEIIGYCQGKLAKFKIPKSVIFLKELPRTHSAKVQKQDLKRQLLSALSPSD